VPVLLARTGAGQQSGEIACRFSFRDINNGHATMILGCARQCSRFCSCQSIQKPQRSTGFRSYTVNSSIEITYFHSITTDFHKRFDLFWEQRVVSSNLTAPTIENADQIELFAPSEKLAGVAFEGGEKFRPRPAVDSRYLPRPIPSAAPVAHIVARQNSIRPEHGPDFELRSGLGRNFLDERWALGDQEPSRGLCEVGAKRATSVLLPQFIFNFDVMFLAVVQAARS